jgi:hypothetical protein
MMIEAVICINQKLLSLDSLIHTNSRGGLIWISADKVILPLRDTVCRVIR